MSSAVSRVVLVNCGGEPQPSFGLAYIYTCLQRRGVETILLDLTFVRQPQTELIRHARSSRTDLWGFSATTYSLARNLELARLVRRHQPAAQIVFGGVHPTLLPRETLLNPEVDAVCVGEGEEALPDFLDRGGQETPGIWLKRADEVLAGPPRPFIHELDALPFPDWRPWDLRRYQEHFILPGTLWVLSSRGCVYDCSYCSNRALSRAVPGRYFRQRTPDSVVDEVLHNLERQPYRSVFFESENFNLHRGNFFARFAERWKAEGLDRRLRWGCKIRADLVTEEWVRLIKDLGCVFVSMGLESGSERIRASYRKAISNETFRQVCDLLEQSGICVNLNVMIGTPVETLADMRESERFARRLRVTSVYYSFFMPLPRTDLGAMTPPPRTATEQLGMRVIHYRARLQENLTILRRGLRERGTSFLVELLRDLVRRKQGRSLWTSLSPRRLLSASPIKSTFYRLKLGPDIEPTAALSRRDPVA